MFVNDIITTNIVVVIRKVFFQFLKKMSESVKITDDAIKPLSRQASVQSVKSVNSSIITPAEVSEKQSSAVGITTPEDSNLSRTSSTKRDSMVSRNSNSGGSGDQEPLMEQSETTELLSEP